MAGRLFVLADGEQVAADNRAVQYDAGDDRDDGERDQSVWNGDGRRVVAEQSGKRAEQFRSSLSASRRCARRSGPPPTRQARNGTRARLRWASAWSRTS